MTDTLTGRQLDEYRLLSLLGKGGMARVYLGQDVRLKRYVAIKVIDRPYRSAEQYIQRFEREAQAVAQLEHPHIVRLYRYGETDELLYMAMQYVEGADLGTILSSYEREGTLIPPGDALRIIGQVAQALDYAHSRGVIHRDVKPSNVVLDSEGSAYLADFGLALLAETGSRGETFGTPQYIAPEQAQSSAEVVPQSDLYALGVLLYEMFTGELPFTGSGPIEVALQHLREAPPPPRQRRADLSPEVEAVILKALAKDPLQRYQSGAQLTSALEQALSATPVTTPIPPPVSPLPSLPERVSRLVAAEGTYPLLDDDRADLPPTGPLAPEPLTPLAAEGRARSPYSLGCIAVLLLLLVLMAFSVVSLLRGDSRYTLSLPLVSGNGTDGPAAATRQPIESTQTPQPEATGTAQPATTAAPVARQQRLRLVTNRDDSLFLVNVGESDLSLDGFIFGQGQGAIRGTQWQVVSLAPGECVSAWKAQGNPEPPRVQCREVGARLSRQSREVFWDQEFNIYYRDSLLVTCQRRADCTIELPADD